MKKVLEEITSDSGLKVLVHDHGDTSEKSLKTSNGKRLYVDYTGYLDDGTIFSSSEINGQQFSFQLGMGQVIPGWEEGFQDKWAGAELTFVIPPHLAYGPNGSRNGEIPGNAILIFEVKIRGVEK